MKPIWDMPVSVPIYGAKDTDRRLFVGWMSSGLLLAGSSGLVACASKPVTSPIQLAITAAADVNPDARNRASPVSVRVYALKTAAAFEAADFFSLFEKDTATLGQDIVRREDILLRPGESKPLEMVLPPEAKVLAVLAAFRDLERARWRVVRAIEVGKPATLSIKVAARQISFE